MKRVVIVQARMTSTRLPGKVVMEVAGRPMLSQVLRRLKRCRLADDIVIATTMNDEDQPVVDLADAEHVRWFRGDEHDVLSRYAGAARESNADLIVRVTSDCPLIDPEIVDRVIQELASHARECDYAANVIERTFPRGLDAEAFFRDVLERVDRLGRSAPAREHVTAFILRERPELFCTLSITDTQDNSDLRWTVDVPEDLEMVRRLYEEMELGERAVGYREIVAYARAHPSLAAINSEVIQKGV